MSVAGLLLAGLRDTKGLRELDWGGDGGEEGCPGWWTICDDLWRSLSLFLIFKGKCTKKAGRSFGVDSALCILRAFFWSSAFPSDQGLLINSKPSPPGFLFIFSFQVNKRYCHFSSMIPFFLSKPPKKKLFPPPPFLFFSFFYRCPFSFLHFPQPLASRPKKSFRFFLLFFLGEGEKRLWPTGFDGEIYELVRSSRLGLGLGRGLGGVRN